MSPVSPVKIRKLTQSQIEDPRLASAKLSGAKRRAFQAEMTLKYCEGKARRIAWVIDYVKLSKRNPKKTPRNRLDF